MEPGIKAFFRTIIQTISSLTLWLMVFIFFGVKLNLAFWGEKPVWQHLVFYIVLVTSFLLLVKYIRGVWKKLPPMDDQDDRPF